MLNFEDLEMPKNETVEEFYGMSSETLNNLSEILELYLEQEIEA